MLLIDVLAVLDSIAPLRHAEAWDNVGLLAGDPGSSITRVLLAIDATNAVFDEAKRAGAELLVAYHPPLFEAIKRVRHDSLIHRAIRDGIAIYSPHTALDVAPGGTNDVLADILGMTSREPLRMIPAAQPEGTGIGRVGSLDTPTDRSALFAQIKKGLEIDALLVAGPLEGEVKTAAVCAGAGRSLLDDAIAKGADLFLTGELPHHDALRAAKAGMTVACALHSNSERAALRALRKRLEEMLSGGVEIAISTEDRDPFTVR
ncbi:MAG: Nif3-like dinuclear metal center hexameric protein [Polyangiaceae bacterium]|nr:Nif3-like dinuclear metal center hexameric protein [Polyangiaceae bacterium]